jgi:hypothetical protein
MKFIGALILIAALSFVAQARADNHTFAARTGAQPLELVKLLPAAEQGDAEAQLRVGYIYKVTMEDYKEAVKWFSKAAKQGNATAQRHLGALYGLGHGVLQDIKRGHMWSNISGANGDISGANNRHFLAARMTPDDISEAEDMARDCLDSDYEDC